MNVCKHVFSQKFCSNRQLKGWVKNMLSIIYDESKRSLYYFLYNFHNIRTKSDSTTSRKTGIFTKRWFLFYHVLLFRALIQ